MVTASRHGDRTAYDRLVHRHARRVFAVCLAITGNVTESEDIAQEAFIKGLTGLHTLREINRFEPWITQIARNLCRDFLRRGNRIVPLEQQPVEVAGGPGDYSDLHEALERLPEKHREPLVLYYLDGEDSKKLARDLEISEAGVHTRLSRARKALRKLLTGEEGNS